MHPIIGKKLCFFFFKQKTAYEMRISDWSSDVCSSDLKLACLRVVFGFAVQVALLQHGDDNDDYEQGQRHEEPDARLGEVVGAGRLLLALRRPFAPRDAPPHQPQPDTPQESGRGQEPDELVALPHPPPSTTASPSPAAP